MSHFVVAVISPKHFDDEQEAQQYIDKILAPYSEHIKVEPYDRECYCIGMNARNRARELAAVKIGKSMDQYHDEYWAIPANERPEWESYIKPYTDAEEELLKQQEDYNKPNPTCGECDGTGYYKSTYNPKSKWDWYQIGGRWTGWLSDNDYNPHEDPLNVETCNICNGIGIRDDWATIDEDGNKKFKDEWAEKCNGCNSCHGTGKRVKWPTQWLAQMSDWNMPVQSVLERWDDGDFAPFAIVTPSGQWIERGQMGWWAMVTNEKDVEDWDKSCLAIFSEHFEGTIITVDCHI